MNIIVGYPRSHDRRSRQARKLGLRYHVEIQQHQPSDAVTIAQALIRSVSYSTITVEGTGGPWRSLQSWSGADYQQLLLHDFGAPVLLVERPETARIQAAFHRLDPPRIEMILASLHEVQPSTTLEHGEMMVRESLRERLTRRLVKHW